MRSMVNVAALVSVLSLAATGALAQTPAAKPAAPATAPAAPPAAAASPVAGTLVRLVVKDVAATKKLLVDSLGGTAGTAGSLESVKFPGLLVLLQKGDPKGGTRGSVVSELALDVKDLTKCVAGLKTAKAKFVTREETNYIYTVKDDVATVPDQQTIQAVVQTPDEVSIRLVENKQAAAPVAFRSVHFTPANVADAKAWYTKAFGAKEGDRGFGYEGLDLGKHANALLFTMAADKVASTEGRSLAHVGFEVRGAALLVQKIKAAGGKIVSPLAKSADTGVPTAVVSDPWGTLIELTEGLKF